MPYKGGKRSKATLKYDKQKYTPEGSQSLTEKQVREEYTRLRAIANKRIKRLGESEWRDTEVYERHRFGFKKLSQLKNERDLAHELSEVARFIDSKRSSASGLRQIRKQAVETLQERGYKDINTSNYNEFVEFMEHARVSNLNKLYGSERVAEYFESKERGEIDEDGLMEAFQKFNKGRAKLDKIQNQTRRNSSQFRRALE